MKAGINHRAKVFVPSRGYYGSGRNTSIINYTVLVKKVVKFNYIQAIYLDRLNRRKIMHSSDERVQRQLTSIALPVNLIRQTIAYLEFHSDPMATMLKDNYKYC